MYEVRKLLEFDKIVVHIKQKALSELVQARLDSLPFLTNKQEIENALQQVSELTALLQFDKAFPLQIWNLRDDLALLRIAGNLLREQAFIRILNTLITAKKVFGYLKERREANPQIWRIAEKLTRCKTLEELIPAKIDLQTSEVKSSASPKLAQIRKSVRQLEQRARKSLESLNRKYAEQGYLQESNLTIKEGRLVLSVKRENKNKIPGLIQDYSATGQTIFIEPLESLQLNNEIQSLKSQEQEEIERILRELTAFAYNEREIIENNFEILCQFDFIQAKALFANEFGCAQPQLNESNNLEIREGRHPLLLASKSPREEVVPLNLSLTSEMKTLVITGPNAGGKSVALKTVGLFALMLQAGIPIPAHPDSSMPVFEQIFADIGDFQSIEQDLSTFTSHLKRIGSILESASDKSLVLIDEIGVGTDPSEGAALSIAILEELTARGCKTLVTTHHGNLKAFAFETDGVQNASMEFEVANLKPTYKLKEGVPGSSYALEICKRLGLPEKLLQRSRQLLGKEKQRLEELILELDKKTQATEKSQQNVELNELRLKALTNLYEEKMASIKQYEKEIKQKALEDAEALLADSNALVENTVKQIKEKQAERETIAKAKQELEQRRQEIRTKKHQLLARPGSADELPARLAVGEAVNWKKQRKTGEIVATQEGSDKVLVQFDSVKFWVPANELTQAENVPPMKEVRASVSIKTEAKDTVLPEIDVRGHIIEDAIAKVDKFLDDATLAGWQQVRVIHGKGTGALRKGLLTYFEKHARVKSQRMGAWNEGDLGVTVVELK